MHEVLSGGGIYVNRVKESFELVYHGHGSHIEINYVAEGRGTQFVEDTPVPVAKGELFFLPSGTSHVFRPSGDELIVYNCWFPASLLERLAGESGMEGSALYFPVLSGTAGWFRLTDRTGRFGVLFEALLEQERRGRGWQRDKEAGAGPSACQTVEQRVEEQRETIGAAGQAVTYGLWLALLGLLEQEVGAARRFSGDVPDAQAQALCGRLPDHALADEAVALIRSQLGQSGLSAGQVARQLGVGTAKLQRTLRSRTGRSFVELLQRERIEHCCKLLRTHAGWKVIQAAESCGYLDMKFFYRLFKRMTGMSPHQYRMRMRAEVPPTEASPPDVT